MAQLVQALVLGLLIGGVYALMASGLTLIFGVMRIINIAQGAFLILVADADVVAVAGDRHRPDPRVGDHDAGDVRARLGALPTVVSRIRGQSASMSVLLTFGIALVIEGVLDVTAGNKFRSVTPAYFDAVLHDRLASPCPRRRCTGASPPWSCSPVLYVVLDPHLDRPGDPGDLAEPVGGGAGRGRARRGTAALAFAIGAASAGVGGSILSVLYPFLPASHYDWISRLLGIVVLGGMGSLPGAVVGALVLGLAETLTATYGSLRWSTLVFYLVIMVVLLVRPQGLFGARLREDGCRGVSEPDGTVTRCACRVPGPGAALAPRGRGVPAGRAALPGGQPVAARTPRASLLLAFLLAIGRSAGTSSPATPATSRSATACSSASASYTVGDPRPAHRRSTRCGSSRSAGSPRSSSRRWSGSVVLRTRGHAFVIITIALLLAAADRARSTCDGADQRLRRDHAAAAVLERGLPEHALLLRCSWLCSCSPCCSAPGSGGPSSAPG